MSRRKRKVNPRQIRVSLSKALDKHFMGCAAVATAAAVGATKHANAAVIYSGVQNIALTNGSPGLYINLVTKTSTLLPSTSPGWDINPYINGGSSGSFFGMYLPSSTTQLVKSSSPTAGAADVAKMSSGTPVGPSSTFIGQPSQFGFMSNATAGDWNLAGTGYMGIEFKEAGVNGGNTVYGWMRISKATDGQPPRGGATGITFVDWAYDDSGAAISAGAGAVPEPTSLALLSAGAVGLCVRRGRAKLRKVEA
jgi:hypothetical protein